MTEFFLGGFCFQDELGRPGHLLQGVQETKLLRNTVELPHSIKDSTEVRYRGYLVAPLCRVIRVILSSSQQFRESVEEVGQLDFPEKKDLGLVGSSADNRTKAVRMWES